MKRIFNFGGGLCSWAAARRVVDRHGTNELTLLFADTNMECEDMPRFLSDCEHDLGLALTVIQDERKRTPWDVFFDQRFMGNSRVDPCSRVLKRELLDKWHRTNCDPKDSVIYVGLSWDESHRVERFKKCMVPWIIKAPNCDPPYLTKTMIADLALKHGIDPPKLHKEGFPHNNCGGFCIKAGQSHFAHLLKMRPDTYAFHERKEQEFRSFIGKDISILKDRTDGKVKPLTLEALRIRIESRNFIDEFDWGGCGCAVS